MLPATTPMDDGEVHHSNGEYEGSWTDPAGTAVVEVCKREGKFLLCTVLNFNLKFRFLMKPLARVRLHLATTGVTLYLHNMYNNQATLCGPHSRQGGWTDEVYWSV